MAGIERIHASVRKYRIIKDARILLIITFQTAMRTTQHHTVKCVMRHLCDHMFLFTYSERYIMFIRI